MHYFNQFQVSAKTFAVTTQYSLEIVFDPRSLQLVEWRGEGGGGGGGGGTACVWRLVISQPSQWTHRHSTTVQSSYGTRQPVSRQTPGEFHPAFHRGHSQTSGHYCQSRGPGRDWQREEDENNLHWTTNIHHGENVRNKKVPQRNREISPKPVSYIIIFYIEINSIDYLFHFQRVVRHWTASQDLVSEQEDKVEETGKSWNS